MIRKPKGKKPLRGVSKEWEGQGRGEMEEQIGWLCWWGGGGGWGPMRSVQASYHVTPA